jgi:hypothetical protein
MDRNAFPADKKKALPRSFSILIRVKASSCYRQRTRASLETQEV